MHVNCVVEGTTRGERSDRLFHACTLRSATPRYTSSNVRPRPQSRPDILRTFRSKRGIGAIKHDRVFLSTDKFLDPWWRSSGDDINLILQSLTKLVEREIILVMTKRVFDLATNGGDTEDDVGADNGAGNGNPAKGVPELEREHDYIHPRDLGDGNAVRDRERSIENPLRAG